MSDLIKKKVLAKDIMTKKVLSDVYFKKNGSMKETTENNADDMSLNLLGYSVWDNKK